MTQPTPAATPPPTPAATALGASGPTGATAATPRSTQALRDAHRHMSAEIGIIRRAADQVSDRPGPEVGEGVEAILSFLTDTLAPHAQAEEDVLYPAVARALGAVNATATMVQDHHRLRAMTAELEDLHPRLTGDVELTPDEVTSLRRILYGLHALVTVHLMKEEEVYLPILDECLSPEQGARLAEEMDTVEQRHRPRAVASS